MGKKHKGVNLKTTILYSNSACTLPKGLPTSQSQTNPSISSYTFLFLSFCIFFLSAIENLCFYQFGPKASNSMYSFSCTYLPEAPLAWACKALSTASFLDWISTSFSHDQKRNIDFKFFFVSLNLF